MSISFFDLKPIRHRGRALLFLLYFASVSFCHLFPQAALADKKFLVLTSYGEGRPGVEALLQGFNSTLLANGVSIDQIYTENLDILRGGKDFYDQLGTMLRQKYRNANFDLVYVVEQPALDFYLNRLQDFFPAAPVIAARADVPESSMVSPHRFFQQLPSYDIKGSLEAALDLFPATSSVLLVSGHTSSDMEVADEAISELKSLKSPIQYEDTRNLSLADMEKLVADPSEKRIILVLPFNSDSQGKTAVQMEVAFKVAAIAGSPVFTLWDNPIGHGAVGGSVTEFTQVGKQAGECALANLTKNHASISPALVQLPLVTTLKFDWSQIRRWGGQAERLPARSVFINKPDSLLETHPALVITASLVFISETILVLVLYVLRYQRRRALSALKESEEKFRILIEEAPEAIVVYDFKADRIVMVNKMAEFLFGDSRDVMMKWGLLHYLPGDQPDGQDPAGSFYENARIAQKNGGITFLRSVRSGKGLNRICEVKLVLLPSAGGNLIRASCIDITEKIEAEKNLKTALAEKEVLLKEVYHRTKNNMQIIVSLLDMQIMQISDEKCRASLQEMTGRIYSMSLVHEKLYESKDLSHIDFGDYVADIVDYFRDTFISKDSPVGISVESQPGINIPIDVAVPCGLALVELVTNSIKYAFPQGQPGSIRISLHQDSRSRLVFEVVDDGIGLPENFDVRRNGKVGLNTVLTLIEGQLRGTIELLEGEGKATGTGFRLSIEYSLPTSA